MGWTQSVWYLPEMGMKENVGVVVVMRAQQHRNGLVGGELRRLLVKECAHHASCEERKGRGGREGKEGKEDDDDTEG